MFSRNWHDGLYLSWRFRHAGRLLTGAAACAAATFGLAIFSEVPGLAPYFLIATFVCLGLIRLPPEST